MLDQVRAYTKAEEDLDHLPPDYLFSFTPETVARHLEIRCQEKARLSQQVLLFPERRRQSWSLLVMSKDRPGLLAKICGALALHGLDVLCSPDIYLERRARWVDVLDVAPSNAARCSLTRTGRPCATTAKPGRSTNRPRRWGSRAQGEAPVPCPAAPRPGVLTEPGYYSTTAPRASIRSSRCILLIVPGPCNRALSDHPQNWGLTSHPGQDRPLEVGAAHWTCSAGQLARTGATWNKAGFPRPDRRSPGCQIPRIRRPRKGPGRPPVKEPTPGFLRRHKGAPTGRGPSWGAPKGGVWGRHLGV